MLHKSQPIGLRGWREATMAPTIEKTRTEAKVKTTSTALSYESSGAVVLIVRANANPPKSSATESATSDQASQEAARRLSPPTPRPGSLLSTDTTPLYSTTVSQALRKALGGRRFRANFGDG